MITINGTKAIDNNKQWVFFTLTVDGDECQFTHIAPIGLTGQDIQNFVNARESLYKLDVLRDMYPGALYQDSIGDTDIEKFESWISSGCINPDETVIEKVTFKGTHPLEAQEKAITAKDTMAEIADMTYAQLGNYIETNVTDLATSKAFIKKLGSVVLAILKRSDWSD